MFKFYLDNNLVNNPINWDEFSETIERNDVIRGLLIKINTKLNFTDDAYAYLYNTKNSNGYCNFVTLKIYKLCNSVDSLLFEGNIRISDCTFHLNNCLVECNIEDDSFGARIFNNKSIKTFVNSGYSKNQVAITPSINLQLSIFEPATATIYARQLTAFDIMDAMNYLVQFMTDGRMNVVSNWYSTLLPDERICIIKGMELRLGNHTNTDVPEVSFQQLFEELNKKFNIGFSIENIAGTWTMRIEPMSFFYDTTNVLTTEYIPDLVESFNTANLYSKVKVGSSKSADYDPSIHSFPPIRFLAFEEESYIIQGQCNIDRELDLSSGFIIDSNVIEELLFTNTTNTSYDKDIFLIQYTIPNGIIVNNEAVAWNDNTSATPVFYNKILTNANVSNRWDVQGNIAQYLNATDNRFMASSTMTMPFQTTVTLSPSYILQTPFNPYAFPDDSTPPNYDANANYNTATYRYTAQANGIYTFRVKFKRKFLQQVDQGGLSTSTFAAFDKWRITANAYSGATLKRSNFQTTLTKSFTDSSLNIANQYLFTYVNPIGSSFDKDVYMNLEDDVYIDLYMNASEQCQIQLEFAYYDLYQERYYPGISVPTGSVYNQEFGVNSYTLQSGSEFECTTTSDGGGIYQGKNVDAYKVSLFKYEFPINETDWINIKSNPKQSINFGIDNATKRGWINLIERNAENGMATIELVSNINNTNQ